MSLRGKSACTVSFFYEKAPLSSCPSFQGKRGSRLLPASRSEGQRWAQKASLATNAPPPHAARVRERRGSERGKPSHSSLIPL